MRLTRHERWIAGFTSAYLVVLTTVAMRRANYEFILYATVAADALAWTMWQRAWSSPDEIAERCV